MAGHAVLAQIAQAYAALVRIEIGERAQQATLARAGRAGEGEDVAGRNTEVDCRQLADAQRLDKQPGCAVGFGGAGRDRLQSRGSAEGGCAIIPADGRADQRLPAPSPS